MINNPQRLEKKWVFKNINKEILIQNLINHNLFFREHFEERFVNSIYFDNLNLKFAEDNLAGISDREKIRIRWYGSNSDTLEKPILEKKIKKNLEGFKKYLKIDHFENKKIDELNLIKLTKSVNKILNTNNLIPITQICYKRIYLISYDHKVRATIDYDVKYKKLKNYIHNFFVKSHDIVLEIKYASHLDSFLRNKINGITRISKNSKYINSLAKNNFFK